jgi:hypothetical protein
MNPLRGISFKKRWVLGATALVLPAAVALRSSPLDMRRRRRPALSPPAGRASRLPRPHRCQGRGH